LKAKKKFQEYITKGVRKIKHRKGFGVHSPFAYSIITEVIEERVPYYAYATMKRYYGSDAVIPLKTAMLLLRLANRFSCRNILEIRSDGGYSALPLLLVDSRNDVCTVASPDEVEAVHHRLHTIEQRMGKLRGIECLASLAEDYRADMMLINSRPAEMGVEEFCTWLLAHSTETTIFFVRGISLGHPMEQVWDQLCDREDVEITMDLYDYGLAIRKPRFFKQHYVVAF
jgi:hypothetical protein